ncbi:hypothetical protein [Niveibacterium terrae]|uniref:hypothetical protein n=1 Tax=Niveibacterium terrae TaxID=3373598 RepID=UPI003A95D4E6
MISVDSELGVSKELRAEIEQFLGEYGEAFSSLNAEAVVSFFAMPFYVELDGDSLVWSYSERAGLIQATDGLLDYYRGLGVQKVDPRIEIILRTGKNRLTVVMSWLLSDDHGTRWVLDKSYHLIREGDSWKIWACCGTETQHH